MILEDIKTLLGMDTVIEQLPEDGVLNIYIRRASTLVREYLNNPYFDNDYITMHFQDAIIEMVVLAYRYKGKENILSMTQGARSATFSDGTRFLITENIKELLPKPYIKFY